MRKQNVLRFTTILHEPRIKLGLTVNEYCIADLINNLGKCFASRQYIADFMGFKWRRSVDRITKRLLEKRLIERVNRKKSYWRVTNTWRDKVVNIRIELKRNQMKNQVKKQGRP